MWTEDAHGNSLRRINPLCAQSVISRSRTQVNRSYSWDCILERTHNGKKTFMCTKCNKLFSDSGKLKVLKRTHTGEKPFVCTQCNELLVRNQINWMYTRELTQNVISSSCAQTNWRCTWGRRKISMCKKCNKPIASSDKLKVQVHMMMTHTG
jgi:phage FluMu protein Com